MLECDSETSEEMNGQENKQNAQLRIITISQLDNVVHEVAVCVNFAARTFALFVRTIIALIVNEIIVEVAR